jgi:hypothetical protein
MLAATFSLSASLFRAYGGILSDRYGARKIMYATFGVSMLCLFMLSYPATDYVVHGIKGDIHFSTSMSLAPFRGDDLRPRLLHVAGQGGRLQAHPGLLSGSCRFGRRAGRPGRWPRRLHPADRVRRGERPHRHLDQLLHGAVRAGRDCTGMDASGDPADGTESGGHRHPVAAGVPGNGHSARRGTSFGPCGGLQAADRMEAGRPGLLGSEMAAVSRGATC